MASSPAPLPLVPLRPLAALAGVACALSAVLSTESAAADPPQPSAEAPPRMEAAKPTPSLASARASASPEDQRRANESIAPLVDDGSMQRAVAVVTGTVGFAGIVVGGVFGILTIARWDQVKGSLGSCSDPESYNGCPARVKEDQLTASAYATVSTYSILTGTVAIGGAMVMWYMSPRLPKSATRITFVPAVSPAGAAAFVMGVF